MDNYINLSLILVGFLSHQAMHQIPVVYPWAQWGWLSMGWPYLTLCPSNWPQLLAVNKRTIVKDILVVQVGVYSIYYQPTFI